MHDMKEYKMTKSAKSIAATKVWATRRANGLKKRGRKLGVKVGPYKVYSLSQMREQIKALEIRVVKLEKVLG